MAIDLIQTTAPQPARFRFWPWLILLVVVLLTGFIRFRLLEMPLERDEGEYAYAGQLILQGIPPYELAYNMKLPGTYYAYAAGMAIFGQTVSGVHLTLMVVNSLIIVLVFLLGRKLFGVTAGLVAGASYGALSVSPMVYGTAAHANFFVLLFALPATMLLWRAGKSDSGFSLFVCGLLYGLAFLMKQQGVFFGLFGWLALIVRQFQEKPRGALIGRTQFGARIAKRSMVFGLGMVLPFGLVCCYLGTAGVFPRFWFWTFTYAHSYVTMTSLPSGGQALSQHLGSTLDQSCGLWIMAAAGLLLGLRDNRLNKQTIFAAGFWICSFLATAAGFYFRPQYFILLLPAFAVLLGLAVVSAQNGLRVRMDANMSRLVPWMIFGALLGLNIFVQARILFQMPPDQTCRAVYPKDPFVEASLVARYIREHATANAHIAVVGSEPEIYFYTKLHSATGYLYTFALMEAQPYAVKMQREMIREIESDQPEYLVVSSTEYTWAFWSNSYHEMVGWINKYTGEFYEKVGLVETHPNGEIICLWDDDARTNNPSPGRFLAVYKRLSAPGIK